MRIYIKGKLIIGIGLIFFAVTLLFPQISLAEPSWGINRISSNDAVVGSSQNIQIAPSKTGWVLLWQDNRDGDTEMYLAKINLLGKRIGKEINITNNTARDETPALVWNREDYGLFWSQERSSIHFMRFDGNGKKIIEDKSIGVKSKGYAIHVSAVWNGKEYGVTWWDVRDAPACNPPGTRGRAFFARVNSDGEMIGEEIPVASAFSNPWQDYQPLILWDGENYAIFWNDSRENGECAGGVSDIYMAKVNRTGEKILGDIKLQSNEPSPQLWDVEWDGENYVIGYNGRIGQGHLAKMDTNGNTIIVDIPINSTGQGGSPMISNYDNKYYIAWGDYRNRTPETFYKEVYYTITGKEGNKLMPETRLSYQTDIQNNTKIVFIKKTIGLAWLDSTEGSPQVYFASNLLDRFNIKKPVITIPIISLFPKFPH